MIGVVAKEHEREVAREFFELFKTPWEFFRPDGQYDVVLSTTGTVPAGNAELLLVYGSDLAQPDDQLPIKGRWKGISLVHKQMRIPIYGHCLVFEPRETEIPLYKV